MTPLETAGAERFLADFLTSFTDEVLGGGDPAPIVDRYYTPDAVQVADGVSIDREKLIAHVGPLRKNLLSSRVEVHEALANGNRIAARLTLHGQLRKRALSTEVHFFGEFTPDGRMCRAHQLTRTLAADPTVEREEVAAGAGR
ncbi:MAG: nuclear transport factor 2 family protein [Streptosporangiales bacterium]